MVKIHVTRSFIIFSIYCVVYIQFCSPFPLILRRYVLLAVSIISLIYQNNTLYLFRKLFTHFVFMTSEIFMKASTRSELLWTIHKVFNCIEIFIFKEFIKRFFTSNIETFFTYLTPSPFLNYWVRKRRDLL